MAGGPARAIVVLGDIPATGHFAQTAAVRGLDLATPEEVIPAFLNFAKRALATMPDGLLVVYPEWQGRAARRVLRLTRGVLDTDRVAGVGLKLPPLACSLVADLLAYSAPHLRIGHLAGLAKRLEREILSGARLASVTRLEHIETRFTDHMASFSPGSGFLAWAAPNPGIARLSGRESMGAIDYRPAEPIHLLIAPQGTDFPDFQEELTSALRPQVVTSVPAQPLGTAFWGTRKHVEFVAFSGHPQALAHFVRTTRYWVCRWCGQPTSLEICAVCGMSQGGTPVAGPTPGHVPHSSAPRPADPEASPSDGAHGSIPPGHGRHRAGAPEGGRGSVRGDPPHNGHRSQARNDTAPMMRIPVEDRTAAGPQEPVTHPNGTARPAHQRPRNS